MSKNKYATHPSMPADTEMLDPVDPDTGSTMSSPQDIGLGAPINGNVSTSQVTPMTADSLNSREKKELTRAEFLKKYPPRPGSFIPVQFQTPAERRANAQVQPKTPVFSK